MLTERLIIHATATSATEHNKCSDSKPVLKAAACPSTPSKRFAVQHVNWWELQLHCVTHCARLVRPRGECASNASMIVQPVHAWHCFCNCCNWSWWINLRSDGKVFSADRVVMLSSKIPLAWFFSDTTLHVKHGTMQRQLDIMTKTSKPKSGCTTKRCLHLRNVNLHCPFKLQFFTWCQLLISQQNISHITQLDLHSKEHQDLCCSCTFVCDKQHNIAPSVMLCSSGWILRKRSGRGRCLRCTFVQHSGSRLWSRNDLFFFVSLQQFGTTVAHLIIWFVHTAASLLVVRRRTDGSLAGSHTPRHSLNNSTS